MFYVCSANFVCVLLFLLSSSVAKVYAATFLILPPKTKMMICDFSWISFPPVNFNLINLRFFFFLLLVPIILNNFHLLFLVIMVCGIDLF